MASQRLSVVSLGIAARRKRNRTFRHRKRACQNGYFVVYRGFRDSSVFVISRNVHGYGIFFGAEVNDTCRFGVTYRLSFRGRTDDHRIVGFVGASKRGAVVHFLIRPGLNRDGALGYYQFSVHAVHVVIFGFVRAVSVGNTDGELIIAFARLYYFYREIRRIIVSVRKRAGCHSGLIRTLERSAVVHPFRAVGRKLHGTLINGQRAVDVRNFVITAFIFAEDVQYGYGEFVVDRAGVGYAFGELRDEIMRRDERARSNRRFFVAVIKGRIVVNLFPIRGRELHEALGHGKITVSVGYIVVMRFVCAVRVLYYDGKLVLGRADFFLRGGKHSLIGMIVQNSARGKLHGFAGQFGIAVRYGRVAGLERDGKRLYGKPTVTVLDIVVRAVFVALFVENLDGKFVVYGSRVGNGRVEITFVSIAVDERGFGGDFTLLFDEFLAVVILFRAARAENDFAAVDGERAGKISHGVVFGLVVALFVADSRHERIFLRTGGNDTAGNSAFERLPFGEFAVGNLVLVASKRRAVVVFHAVARTYAYRALLHGERAGSVLDNVVGSNVGALLVQYHAGYMIDAFADFGLRTADHDFCRVSALEFAVFDLPLRFRMLLPVVGKYRRSRSEHDFFLPSVDNARTYHGEQDGKHRKDAYYRRTHYIYQFRFS